MLKVILITGKARHGKDTIANILKENLENNNKKVIITHLAKYLKLYAIEMTSWQGDEENKPREFLNILGTDVIRKKLKKEDFLINRNIEDIFIYSHFFDYVIIPDVRFKIEIDRIKENFKDVITIKVERPNFDNNLKKLKEHEVEVSLDEYNDYDYIVINDSTILNLEEKIKEIIMKGKIL